MKNTTPKQTENEIYEAYEKKMEEARSEYLRYPCDLAGQTFNTRMDVALQQRDAALIENGYELPTL
jgi:hypothetical protein